MNEFLNSALFWFLLGIFFLLIEISHFGFVIFFFGFGAFIVAILTWGGVIHSPVIQLLIFICSSLLCLFLFRNWISSVFKGKISGKNQSVDNIIGEKAIVVIEISPNSISGKVEYNGTMWQAQSENDIEKGAVVEIISRDNLILKVKPVG
jgi:membrane protein implicated in regulation of membrane protease activity